MTTQAERLKRAKELIQDPAHWVQDWYARNEQDRDVNPDSPDAVKFCALGALYRNEDHDIHDTLLLTGCSTYLYRMSITDANDHIGHHAVMKIYDRAIQLAGA